MATTNIAGVGDLELDLGRPPGRGRGGRRDRRRRRLRVRLGALDTADSLIIVADAPGERLTRSGPDLLGPRGLRTRARHRGQRGRRRRVRLDPLGRERDRVMGLVDLASSLPGNSQWLSAVGQTATDAQRGDRRDRRRDVRVEALGRRRLADPDGPGCPRAAFSTRSRRTRRTARARPIRSSRSRRAARPRSRGRVGTARSTASRCAGSRRRRSRAAVSTRSANGVEAQNPAVAVRPGGRIMLAWQALDGNDNRIEYSVGSLRRSVDDQVAVPPGGVATRP